MRDADASAEGRRDGVAAEAEASGNGFSRGSAHERAQRGQQAARDLDQQTVRDPLLRTAQLNPQLLQGARESSSNISATNRPSPGSQTDSNTLADVIAFHCLP